MHLFFLPHGVVVGFIGSPRGEEVLGFIGSPPPPMWSGGGGDHGVALPRGVEVVGFIGSPHAVVERAGINRVPPLPVERRSCTSTVSNSRAGGGTQGT